jgi:hypothetical protein
MAAAVDEAVMNVTNSLTKKQMHLNTITIVTADNGGPMSGLQPS